MYMYVYTHTYVCVILLSFYHLLSLVQLLYMVGLLCTIYCLHGFIHYLDVKESLHMLMEIT